NYLFVRDDAFYKVNFNTKKVEKKYDIPNCNALIKWGKNELLYCDIITFEVKAVNLSNGEITYPFKNLKDQFGKPIDAYLRFAERINDSQYVFTSFAEGIYIYNTVTGKIFNYRHSLTNPASLGSNTQIKLVAGKKGWVFISCMSSGISYFNNNDFIGTQTVFADNKGNGFDGFIAGIATKDNNTYYVGTAEGMLRWKRNTNTTTFIDIKDKQGQSVFTKAEVISIAMDNSSRIWATTKEKGIIVLNENLQLVRQIEFTGINGSGSRIKRPARLVMGPDGNMWSCGGNGIISINTKTFSIDTFGGTPLARFTKRACAPILFTDKNNLWFASSVSGVFHYNLQTKNLDSFNTEKGLVSNIIFALNCDNMKNVYVGSIAGLNILFTNGYIKTISQKNGLLIDRAEGLLLDEHNRMWIGNDIGLACYNPADSSLKTFDERYGLSIYGFRVGSYFKMSNKEFIFGTPHGLQYFNPDSLYNKRIELNALISKIETRSFVSSITDNAEFILKSENNQVTFYFSTVDFRPHLRTYYQYMLAGVDKDWVAAADVNSVRYNSLPPGKFIFKLRISNDRKTWQDADNEVTVIIEAAFYQKWWFKAIGVLIGIFLIWYVFRYYQHKQEKKREELETELVVSYFASQINSRSNTDELLWDVAKNLIGKLRFEECMIYLWNKEKTILIQKAGYGSKGSMQKIMDRTGYDIPRGKGIVGAAVESKQNILVNDTSRDNRYFAADGEIMLSELCVPLIHDNEVLGAINIEHHQKNYFTHKHLQVLSTIALLCVNQVKRIRAEEEKQQTTIELLENKRRAMESRLQSLRLQMNPHFLFNALNSVQQMILANEEMVATRYLSRFSKLLRAVLVHSDKESISLKDELEILNLYVELESIRFKGSFHYEISCDETIDTDEIKIPTLLVQPFVENAIWHGLMHKEGERFLKISFNEEDDFIKCTVEDNGIGRNKAAEMKMAIGREKTHASKGIEVSKERMKTLRSKEGVEGNIKITDQVDQKGVGCGTKVEIKFPIQN
ncbi:MAG TPA: histidine kinase, partial [Chitinophagaceae bacterium]|nr:histidine kinase [Chitinophagaceae bacterium]